tara:strand:+ start:5349 stop:5798 length:450 start_codon:yes stop_codon:yes gene_type:complete
MSDSDNDSNENADMNNDYINSITMNFLMNKSQHNKFVSIEDPGKYQREQRHIRSLIKHKNEILNLTRRLICEPDTQITTDVNESFNDYTRTLLRYLKMKDIENKGYDNNSDDDVLFGSVDESEDEGHVESNCPNVDDITSFWGTKLIKK